MSERGVALVVSLWVSALLTVLAAAAMAAARDAASTGSWRMDAIRDSWASRGCLATVRRGLDRALEDADLDAWTWPERVWTPPGCALSFTSPATGPVDLNRADTARLVTLPGFTPDLARLVVRQRDAGPYRDLDDLIARLGNAGAPLAESYAALRARTVVRAWAWDVRAAVGAGVRRVVTQRWIWGGAGRVVVVREWLS